MKVRASAPSNIALIKYMGKTDAAQNRPLNSSLSWTLQGLRTEVELEWDSALVNSRWEPLDPGQGFRLSEKGAQKFLGHLERIKTRYRRTENFIVRSQNNFPSDAGIASSASSFAALTMAAVQAFGQMDSSFQRPSFKEQSDLSRQGSGSSCRSFFGPWSLWDQEGASGLELGPSDLIHQVVLVDSGVKSVSSSQAHVQCATSELFKGRKERAETRLQELISGLKSQDWERSFQLAWSEFWDMHALFETSKPSFGYLKPGTLAVLEQVRACWIQEKDGPLATLDAGPNVHLLWRNSQRILAQDFASQFKERFQVLTTWSPSEVSK